MAIFSGLGFLLGAFASAFSGYAGMWVSVRANSRVAAAAKRCYNDAILIAFKGGYFASVINVALAIFGVSSLFLVYYFYLISNLPAHVVNDPDISIHTYVPIEKIPLLMIGFGFGASFVAMFA